MLIIQQLHMIEQQFITPAIIVEHEKMKMYAQFFP
jgi:hypothetical protein